MGIQKNMIISGTFGGVIYYKSMGQGLMRSKPSKIKQTKATKAEAGIFGKAVKASASLRLLLKPLLPDATDRKMMHRLDAALRNWMRTRPFTKKKTEDNLPFITGFEFNETSKLAERFRKVFTVSRTQDGNVALHIPALYPAKDIIAPADTKSIRLKIIAAVCGIMPKVYTTNYCTEICISYTDEKIEAQEILLPVQPAAGNLTVVAIALDYYKSPDGITKKVNIARWTPAAIVGCMWG